MPSHLSSSSFGLAMWSRNRVILATLVFLVAYGLGVFLWVHIKAYYGMAITSVGAHLSALVSGCFVDRIEFHGERAVCNFVYQALTVRGPANLHFATQLYVSNYSYNVPLTLSLMAALYPFIKYKRRFLVEALGLLVVIHVLYVFWYCGLQTYYSLIKAGVKTVWKPEAFFWEFPWVFINAMVIRFEPFLIGAFLWFRNMGFKVSVQDRAA